MFDNFGEKLLENIHVLAVLIALIVAFVGMSFFTRIKDKADALKVSLNNVI